MDPRAACASSTCIFNIVLDIAHMMCSFAAAGSFSAASRVRECEKRAMKTMKKTRTWTRTRTTQRQRISDDYDTPTAHTAQQHTCPRTRNLGVRT